MEQHGTVGVFTCAWVVRVRLLYPSIWMDRLGNRAGRFVGRKPFWE